jgi:hypothetical protein
MFKKSGKATTLGIVKPPSENDRKADAKPPENDDKKHQDNQKK